MLLLGTDDFEPYGHVGAVIVDTCLQAGLNYRTVVRPRVERLIAGSPLYRTTSGFAQYVNSPNLESLIDWHGTEKLERIRDVTGLLLTNSVDTELELRDWLQNEVNILALRNIRGIGPKSVDYMRKLVGIPAIPIDRHLKTFATSAGVNLDKYAELEQCYRFAADLLGVSLFVLDSAIWDMVSATSRPRCKSSQPSLFDDVTAD